MKNKSIVTDLILASGAPGLLLLAFIFEMILGAMMPGQNEPVSAGMRVVFLTPLFELLLMAAVVGLIWALNANRNYGRVVSAAYLIIGLLVLYSNALLAVLPLPDALYVMVMYAAPDTMVFQASGALAALGLMSLWFWQAPETAAETAPEAAEAEAETPAEAKTAEG